MNAIAIPSIIVTKGTPQAVKLYGIIARELHFGNPAPARKDLAEAMGFSRTKSVDAYVRELEDLGHLNVRRVQGQGARSIYSLAGR
ncbi:helix-turn-helix DNA binding domain protein [Arthrobacter phage Salgado]|uniref:HTH DNA binding domain protein n=2 Tax=Laroyevirus TaxID=1982086 RepID=A0A0U4B6A2_9CAUD|nr:transcriptional repressor [Arthrobacter phage LiSara]YP_010082696.1 transcriptional repressor [Arthrobacter phage Salgado]ALY10253.1 helix-turn-helix DNA binding domain protein [Arthrobacter phage Salgado]ASR83668.1 helix-turn-helix DNA binding domain protein [Arthrobacter phage LiSara]